MQSPRPALAIVHTSSHPPRTLALLDSPAPSAANPPLLPAPPYLRTRGTRPLLLLLPGGKPRPAPPTLYPPPHQALASPPAALAICLSFSLTPGKPPPAPHTPPLCYPITTKGRGEPRPPTSAAKPPHPPCSSHFLLSFLPRGKLPLLARPPRMHQHSVPARRRAHLLNPCSHSSPPLPGGKPKTHPALLISATAPAATRGTPGTNARPRNLPAEPAPYIRCARFPSPLPLYPGVNCSPTPCTHQQTRGAARPCYARLLDPPSRNAAKRPTRFSPLPPGKPALACTLQ